MNTPPKPTQQTASNPNLPAGRQPVSQPTPPSPQGTQVSTPAPSPETAKAPMHTSVPDQAAGGATPPGTATSTHTDTPVATVAPTSPLPQQERDASQGTAAKGGPSGQTIHPVTGQSTNEYVLSGTELLQHASHKFGIDTARGVTELRWDEANQRMIVRHSPPPPSTMQG